MVVMTRLATFTAAVAMLAATGSNALAQKKYDTGASDTEIKIGNIMPYSGPASAYGAIGKTLATRFSGWRVGIIASDASLAAATGLPVVTAGKAVLHGGIRVHLYRSEGPLP